MKVRITDLSTLQTEIYGVSIPTRKRLWDVITALATHYTLVFGMKWKDSVSYAKNRIFRMVDLSTL